MENNLLTEVNFEKLNPQCGIKEKENGGER